MDTPLTDQVIDLALQRLRDGGVAAFQVYDSIGRVWPGAVATPDMLDVARGQYCNEDVEIDDNALTSRSSIGVWVAAWVWLANIDIGKKEGEDE